MNGKMLVEDIWLEAIRLILEKDRGAIHQPGEGPDFRRRSTDQHFRLPVIQQIGLQGHSLTPLIPKICGERFRLGERRVRMDRNGVTVTGKIFANCPAHALGAAGHKYGLSFVHAVTRI